MQIWDPHIISETTGASKLKLKTQLDVVKYSLRVQNFSVRWHTGAKGQEPDLGLRYTGFLHFSGISEEVMDGFR